MRLRPDQLDSALAAGRLAPIYLVTGDEPLQAMECADAIRAAARRAGAGERIVLDVEPGFEWGSLAAESGSLSLFSSRRLIELRLGTARAGVEGSKVLAGYAESAGSDDVLLVTAARLDAKALQAAWCKAFDRVGVIVQVWPLAARELSGWLERRAGARGVTLPPGGASLIADRVEGNLLAAAQEIDKLALRLGDGGAIDADGLWATVSDSARFDAFGLVDAALNGEVGRCLRILDGLRAEGVEPVLVSAVLAREIRTLATVAEACAGGMAPDQALAAARVWDKRKPFVRSALRRLRVAGARQLLRRAARLDRTVKGWGEGAPWEELTWVCLGLAGVPLAWAGEPPPA
ncbi:MAG: DNA polymerase III subunit delta [Gammaproteobacteria bacterium]|nr:DNA polymerase III subunit delta [Gammaproteobacteria bacterium]